MEYCSQLNCYELGCGHFEGLVKGSWVSESIVEGWRQQIQVDDVLVEERDKLAHRGVFINRSLGRVLMIDGRVQLTSRDERCYHEMFVHVPFMMHGEVKQVLVIGGGDGMTLREILKHTHVHCTLVEIDPAIVEFSRRYLQGSWDNPRVTVIIEDGAKFVQTHKGSYDVIVVDSTDPTPDGCSSVLYQQAFYQSCCALLSAGGILVTQNGHPNFDAYSQTALSHLAACFACTTVYQFCVPTYIGGLQAFGWASDNKELLNVPVDELSRRWDKTGITDVETYSPEYGKSCFCLPRWMMKMVQDANDSAKDLPP
jgi:spermidine synthase